ncbi:MAG: acylphosphatase, partial [Atopobiaceae bacterium]|nr:acylphosphatase [Atopobiaceae bacterium]
MRRLSLRFEGEVQGVGFRWTSRRLAQEIGLTGWVRNEWDGSVS